MITTTRPDAGRERPHGLAALFAPRSIAVIGASADRERIGGRIVGYLKDNFPGAILPINPGRETIQDLPAYPSIDAAIERTGEPVDLALVAIPAAAAVEALEASAARRVGAAVVFSSGFAEAGAEGRELQDRTRRIAETSGMAVLGPNCLGSIDLQSGVTATFSIVLDITPLRPGNVAVVSQSGAFAAHVLALSGTRGLGLSKWVTTGNECAVDTADVIAFLADDPATEVIMLYLEGCRDGGKLRDALEKARRAGKPVIAVKVGRSEEGSRAALSHTAAIAGSDQGYDALFEATGVHRVRDVDSFIDVAAAASTGRLPQGRRAALVSMSGGMGILMADRCADLGLTVPALPQEVQARLATMLPHSSVENPIDVTAQIINEPELFGATVDAVLDSGAADALAIFLTTVAHVPKLREKLMQVFAALRRSHPRSVLGVCMLAPEEVRRELAGLGYVQIEAPSRLVETIAALAAIREKLAAPGRPAAPADAALRLDLGGGRLDENGAKRALRAAGLPFAEERLARSAAEAAETAAAIGFPVALKLSSPDVRHKSEIGGVILDLADAEAVAAAFDTILVRVREQAPGATVDGVLVAPMVRGGTEVILGGRIDDVAGPLVTVGAGGIFVEVFGDVATACAPVDAAGAERLVSSLKIAPILNGARGRAKADIAALAAIIARFSEILAANAGRIDTMEINPLIVLAEGRGALGVDALIVPRGAAPDF